MANFNVSPSLFIGLGTTGWLILDELRRLLYEEFGQAGLPCFRYLAFESNKTKKSNDAFLPHRAKDYETITPIYITVPDLPAVGQKLNPASRDGYKPQLEAWLDSTLIKRGGKGFEAGAGAMRQAGRLCLWENWATVTKEIGKAIASINAPQNMSATDDFLRQQYFPQKRVGAKVPATSLVDAMAKVYVFGTFCGGTCSGTFLDIAYYLGKMLLAKPRVDLRNVKHPELIGIFTVVDTLKMNDENRRQQLINCWASLRELDYYTQPSSRYQVVFPDGLPIDTADEPFDWVYIESMRNQAGTSFTDPPDLTQMCAMNLFTEVVAGTADKKNEIRVDFRNTSEAYLKRNEHNHIRAFSSFGLSAIWHPRYRIAQAVNRYLGVEIFSDWIGRTEPERAKVEDSAKAEWEKFIAKARGSLVGTVNGARCSLNLPNEIESIFDRREAEFTAIDQFGLQDYISNFPPDGNSLAQRLSNPQGDYFRYIASAETHVESDLKADLESAIVSFLSTHTVREAQVYITYLSDLARQLEETLPDQIPVFSQGMDFSYAPLVYTDPWTRLVRLGPAAIAEYKRAIWMDFKNRTQMHLGIICDHFVKRILTPVRAQLAKLGDRTNRFGIKLGVVYEKCEAEKKEFVKLQHANNIVPISRRHTSEIAGESEDHAKDILSKNTITALRDLYRNQEAPLQLFESTEPEELVARVDRSFASLSQRLINNFHIGREVVDHLQQKIQGLVLSSVPYIETDTVWQPMKCNRSPNLLFTPDQETGNKLEELTRSDLMGSKYDPMESPLEHFAIFYQETPGLAISDLALAQAGQTSLDTDEKSPRMCTNFLHKNGEASISLKLLEDSGPALQWINAMRYLKPSLFKTINDKFYIQYPGEMGMKQDLFVDDPASLRACLTTFGMDGLQKLFAAALKEDGKEAIIQRMETKMSQAASHDERKLLQAFHAVILKTVF